MNYQWYPGHMTKARRMMQENIKLIDLVIELVDARIPISSRNPDIDELGKGKSRIILLNKSDLADPVWNKKWVEYFSNQGMGTGFPNIRHFYFNIIISHFYSFYCGCLVSVKADGLCLS